MSKKRTRLGKSRSGSMAVLDIGTTKIACFIAQVDAGGEIKITGIGHQLSRGIRSGVITDIVEAETSIISAVHAAEQMAGETIDDVIVSLSGGNIISRNVTVEMSLLDEEVTERDMLDLVEQGRQSMVTPDTDLIHCFPISYCLDGSRGVQDPRQMYGKKLGVDLHVVTASASVTRNLVHCLAHCHLNVLEFVVASHASAKACLEPDETQLGVTLIDMGGGVTSFSIFSGGKNIYADAVPIGGMHVTNDIAMGLSTSLAHAERLKTLHGSAVISPSDDHVMIDAPLLGEGGEGEESNVMPRSMLVGIIRPRMEEIFEMIRGRIELSGMAQNAGRRVVLTGGASQLIGARELAASMLGKQVRLARPRPLIGLAEAVSGPAFSTALGMLDYALKRPLEDQLLEVHMGRSGLGGGWQRMLNWFRENF